MSVKRLENGNGNEKGDGIGRTLIAGGSIPERSGGERGTHAAGGQSQNADEHVIRTQKLDSYRIHKERFLSSNMH